MASRLDKRNGEALVCGDWGSRNLGAIGERERDRMLHRELVESGVLPANSVPPSRRIRSHVTLVIGYCSWSEGRWVLDGPLPESAQETVRAAMMDQGMVAAVSRAL